MNSQPQPNGGNNNSGSNNGRRSSTSTGHVYGLRDRAHSKPRPAVFNPAKLREKRVAAGYNQSEVSRLTGIGQPVISRHENFASAAVPNSADLVAYCKLYRCQPGDLMSTADVYAADLQAFKGSVSPGYKDMGPGQLMLQKLAEAAARGDGNGKVVTKANRAAKAQRHVR